MFCKLKIKIIWDTDRTIYVYCFAACYSQVADFRFFDSGFHSEQQSIDSLFCAFAPTLSAAKRSYTNIRSQPNPLHCSLAPLSCKSLVFESFRNFCSIIFNIPTINCLNYYESLWLLWLYRDYCIILLNSLLSEAVKDLCASICELQSSGALWLCTWW